MSNPNEKGNKGNGSASNTRKAEKKENDKLKAEHEGEVQEGKTALSPSFDSALAEFKADASKRNASWWLLAVAVLAEMARGWRFPAIHNACAAKGIHEISGVDVVKNLAAMVPTRDTLIGWGMDREYLESLPHSLWITIARLVAHEKDCKGSKSKYREKVKGLLNGSQGIVTASTLRDFLNSAKGKKAKAEKSADKAENGENQVLDVSEATQGALCEMARLLFARAQEIGPEAVAALAECTAKCIDEIEQAELDSAKTESEPVEETAKAAA